MAHRPLSVSATLTSVSATALVWLALGVIIAVGAHPAIPDVPQVRTSMALGSLAAGAVLVFLVVLLWRRVRLAYSLTLAALIASSLAVFFDDVGWADLIVLALSLIPLLLLIKDRAWYLGASDRGARGS
jgi:hypothetical protein